MEVVEEALQLGKEREKEGEKEGEKQPLRLEAPDWRIWRRLVLERNGAVDDLLPGL